MEIKHTELNLSVVELQQNQGIYSQKIFYFWCTARVNALWRYFMDYIFLPWSVLLWWVLYSPKNTDLHQEDLNCHLLFPTHGLFPVHLPFRFIWAINLQLTQAHQVLQKLRLCLTRYSFLFQNWLIKRFRQSFFIQHLRKNFDKPTFN